MVAQDGGQHGWSLLLGGAALGVAAAAAAYTAALYLEQTPRSHTLRQRRRARQRRRQQAADAASELSADDESSLADEDDGERTGAASTIDGPLVDGVQQRHSRRSRLTNGHAASNDSAFADANGDSQRNGGPLPSAQQGATPPKSRRVRMAQKGSSGSGAKLAGPMTPASASSWRQEHHYRDSPTPSIEGGEAARQMRNAPQPKFLGGPANRSGHVQVQAQEVLAHESPIMERHSSAATLHRAGAPQQPAPAPGHMVPGTLLSHPGHAPAPNHHLSTAPELITEGQMMENAALHEQYTRVITPEPALNEETEDVCALLKECYDLRDKWLFVSATPLSSELPEVANPSDLFTHDPFDFDTSDPDTQPSEFDFEMQHGVIKVWLDASRDALIADTPGDSHEFFVDMHRMLAIQAMGAPRSFCFHRLLLLEQKFNLHVMMNADKEFLAQKAAPHRDFYNVRKVDTHIHHSACMHQKHLLRFIKSKLRKEPDQVVIFRDGKYLTLAEVFESLKMTGHDLNVDTLDMHADKNIFHRFDKFNLKYNPCGQSRLREIFIKQDNIIHGRFLAELTQEVVSDLEASKYQHAELRISIYGRKRVEWDILAAWICQHQLYSNNVVWLIQIPRLYAVYKEQGIIETFEQMLDNIFTPLFEVTKDPTTHPQLHLFLKQCVGFDMVDDESKPERRPNKHMQRPDAWNLKHNPAYSYYAFYTYANLYTLNKFREARGLNTFTFRPHAGEAGDVDHLASAFMLCENIAHGINLRKSPCMQYLYYLKQIGLCMSPLSNNSLFLDYHRNPLPTFFARGLNVSLSTDDPLQIHLTKEPLVEEYSVAAQVWKLSATDLCEIARASVLHSGFPHQVKMHWVHCHYWKMGPEGNDIQKTNVPNLRMRFRAETFYDELSTVLSGAAAHSQRKGALSS